MPAEPRNQIYRHSLLQKSEVGFAYIANSDRWCFSPNLSKVHEETRDIVYMGREMGNEPLCCSVLTCLVFDVEDVEVLL